MKLIFAFLVSLSIVIITSAEWVIQPNTTTSICIGVGAGTKNIDVAATSSQTNPSSVDALVELYANGNWTALPCDSSSGLLFDAAISLDSSLKVASSLFPVFVSNATNAPFTQVPNLGGTIQSASVFGNNNIGLVGGIVFNKKSYNGVAVSLDRGSSFKVYNIPSGYARYGAFVDSNTWFISAGIWSDGIATVDAALTLSPAFATNMPVKPLSRKIRFNQSTGYTPSVFESTNTSYPNANGWLASISRTTDGGKSWTEVFHNVEGSAYYFNGISCSSATNCVVVGEGEDTTGADMTLALTTTDGGNTWVKTFQSTEVISAMAVKLVDSKNGWFAGLIKKRLAYDGQFFATTDGGITWTLAQTVTDCYPVDLDLSDDGSTGVASCLSSSGSSASIALYNA